MFSWRQQMEYEREISPRADISINPLGSAVIGIILHFLWCQFVAMCIIDEFWPLVFRARRNWFRRSWNSVNYGKYNRKWIQNYPVRLERDTIPKWNSWCIASKCLQEVRFLPEMIAFRAVPARFQFHYSLPFCTLPRSIIVLPFAYSLIYRCLVVNT